MTVTWYSSTDASAPVITGSVASGSNLVNLLTAVLVTGYGAKPAAGWTKPQTAANAAAFLQGAGAVNPVAISIDDSSAPYSRVRGFESVTTATTGTNGFPTDAQLSGGAYGVRSSTSDATARAWELAADDRTFTLYIDYDGTGNNQAFIHFGDIATYKSGDIAHKILIAGTSTSPTTVAVATMASLSTAVSGHWMLRSYTQSGTAITVGKHTDSAKYGQLAYPHPVDGGTWLGAVWVHENTLLVVRGTLRGLWCHLHSTGRPLSQGDLLLGTGPLAGRSFLAQNSYNGKQMFLETSDTWDA